MPFSDFQGNTETVRRLREMLGRGHFPHALILAGGRGAGKYTLALMLARAMNCLGFTGEDAPPQDGLPDYCGRCTNCLRIGQAADLDTKFAEAVEARENLRETDKKETRILIQTHPDVLVIPPDPPQMLVKVDQVRRVIHSIYMKPAEAKEKVIVGVNGFVIEEESPHILYIDESVARQQSAKLKALRARRSNDEVRRALDGLKKAAGQQPKAGTNGNISPANTMPYIVDAVRAYATVGEICEALREVYGAYTEVSIT